TVLGWGRHDTDGVVESVCAGAEGDEDAVYLVVRRTIDGVERRFIERMKSRIPPFAPIPRGAPETMRERDTLLRWFVDCGLSYDGRNRDPTKTVAIGITTGGWTENDTLTLAAFDTVTGSTRSMFAPGDVGDQVEVALYATTLDAESCQYVTTLTARVRFVIDEYIAPFRVNGHTIGDVPPELQGGQLANLSDWVFKRNVFSGLDHLEGKTVSVYADGNVHPSRVVVDGAITLQDPAGVVVVGLPYCSDLETLELNVIGGESVRAKQKLVTELGVQVQETRNIVAGTSFDPDRMMEWKPRDEDDGYLDPVSELTGIARVNLLGDWLANGHVCIRQNLPLPITVLAVIPKVDIGG
ncbi:MAG TPA: hypothetical protein VJ724_01355, partial [Tahibacter sp.]|nr:hypothetical protein [Tahibacter sp.]